MRRVTRNALADRLSPYGRVVEVGIGERTAVAATLAERDVVVTATDVRPCEVPDAVVFVRDDVTDPDPAVYRQAAAVYGLNLPPELHRPLRAVAGTAGADCLFTTLGTEPPAVPATPETLPDETLYTATEADPA